MNRRDKEVITVIINPKLSESNVQDLPVLKPEKVSFISRYYRSGSNLYMELIYNGESWVPTWKLAEGTVGALLYTDNVDVKFVVTVLEGTVLKRVEKTKSKTRTTLFLVTRWGLIELFYDYERGVYVLANGLRIPDDRKKKSN